VSAAAVAAARQRANILQLALGSGNVVVVRLKLVFAAEELEVGVDFSGGLAA